MRREKQARRLVLLPWNYYPWLPRRWLRNGNNSKKFLSCSQNLTELLPTSVSSAVTDLLMKFHLVVSGYFFYYLAPEYQRYFKEF